MGADSSKGGIYIQLENSSLFSGQEAAGVIHMSIKAPLPPSVLTLIFRGKERTHWEVQRQTRRNDSLVEAAAKQIPEMYNGESLICNFHYPIYRFDSGVEVGDYSLPFTFKLPENIPGSFRYSSGSTKATISYKFKAHLKASDALSHEGETRVHIRQLAHTMLTDLSANKKAVMKTWCCIDKGTCDISIKYPQDTYNPNQVAKFHAEIDNSASKLNVEQVNCTLCSSIRMKSDGLIGSTHFVKTVLISQKVPVTIPSGGNLLSNSGIEIELNLPSVNSTLADMYSTKGNIIECIYTISIEADMSGSCMCCGDYPKIDSVMNIVPNGTFAPVVQAPPPDWNPTRLDAVGVLYDPRFNILDTKVI